MAKTTSDGWQVLSVTGQAQREIETLGLLATALPDGYSVYHAVHWAQKPPESCPQLRWITR